MKIVCEACQAKYSIADEKVRGKVFKIRCKKCSHVIVVRGAGDAGGEAVTPAVSLDAVTEGWHIVVDGEQVGPLSVSDLRGRLSRGEISRETYVWKEGLTDWVKLATVPEFADAAEPGTPFEGGADADPFAGAETAVSAPGGMAAVAGASAPAAGDLFAAPSSAVAAPSPRVGYSAPAADPFLGASANGAGGAGGLTAQRHENSVLFSLANLEALAKPSVPAPAGPVGGAGYASTTSEGSGLIDIRAMANMTLGAVASKDDGPADDLPAFSAPQFSPVAPVLLPLGSAGTPRWAMAVLVGLGVAIVSLTILLIVVWSRDPAPVVVQAPPAEPAEGPAAAAPPAPKAEAPPPTPPPVEDEALPPREAPPKAEASAAAGTDDDKKSRRDRRRRPRGEAEADPVIPVPSRRSAPVAEAPRKPKDDIEALLEAAAGTRRPSGAAPRPAASAPAASGEKLPPLSRGQVVKGMNAVLPKAKACYQRFNVPGTAMAKITVEPTGRVSKATVSGKFAGTPSGECVEAALRSAQFDRSGGLTFDYPVALR